VRSGHAARSAGKFVLVQRLSTTRAATLKKVILDANSSATLPFAIAPRRLAAASSDADRADAPGYITRVSRRRR
jgi:hypothetical protein